MSTKRHSWKESREALERVNEYVRQAKLATRPPVEVIHGIFADKDAEMADLTLADLQLVLARLQRTEEVLAACQEQLMKYES